MPACQTGPTLPRPAQNAPRFPWGCAWSLTAAYNPLERPFSGTLTFLGNLVGFSYRFLATHSYLPPTSLVFVHEDNFYFGDFTDTPAANSAK